MPGPISSSYSGPKDASIPTWMCERPKGSNADEWNLFLAEHQDATAFVAVQICNAIEAAAVEQRLKIDSGLTERAQKTIDALQQPDRSLSLVVNTVRQSIAEVIIGLVARCEAEASAARLAAEILGRKEVAAAPDLLAALRMLVDYLTTPDPNKGALLTPALNAAQAALARAEAPLT